MISQQWQPLASSHLCVYECVPPKLKVCFDDCVCVRVCPLAACLQHINSPFIMGVSFSLHLKLWSIKPPDNKLTCKSAKLLLFNVNTHRRSKTQCFTWFYEFVMVFRSVTPNLPVRLDVGATRGQLEAQKRCALVNCLLLWKDMTPVEHYTYDILTQTVHTFELRGL